MPAASITIGPWTFPTFNLFIAVAVLVSVGLGVRCARQTRIGWLVDAYLGALLGGVIFARLGHVLLAWDYFQAVPSEILRVDLGGLNWHGAVIGGLAGLALAARWRRLAFRALLDGLTPALPLIGLAGWWGCWAAACGYGAEVDTLAHYPGLVVAESADIFGIVAPRFNTQLFGLALALLALTAAGGLIALGWLRQRRFWLVLALLSAGMFVIGFFRGDYVAVAAGLRLDQWLDGALLALGIQQMLVAHPRAEGWP